MNECGTRGCGGPHCAHADWYYELRDEEYALRQQLDAATARAEAAEKALRRIISSATDNTGEGIEDNVRDAVAIALCVLAAAPPAHAPKPDL